MLIIKRLLMIDNQQNTGGKGKKNEFNCKFINNFNIYCKNVPVPKLAYILQ
jgi:hypothetical protein